MLVDCCSELREPHAARRAFQQFHAELILEFRNPAADRGNGYLQAPSSLGKAVGFDDFCKRHQCVEICHRLTFTAEPALPTSIPHAIDPLQIWKSPFRN